jgi:hypothetical protein
LLHKKSGASHRSCWLGGCGISTAREKVVHANAGSCPLAAPERVTILSSLLLLLVPWGMEALEGRLERVGSL